MTRRDALERGKRELTLTGIEDAMVDAWYLLEWVTGISRAEYYGYPERELTQQEEKKYLHAISERSRHVPLQHITGEQMFMGLLFRVNEHVLIPRQDTEVLVENGLSILKPGMRVLDMCTGSGCILISIEQLGGVQGTFLGTDISQKALEKARENVQLHDAKVELRQSDLFENVTETFDMILSNPPYIRTAVIEKLQDEVRCHDPYIALDGKEDGLYFYRRIVSESKEHLSDGGWLLLEIGHDQGKDVSDLMKMAGYEQVTVKKDLAGLDRVVFGRYNTKRGKV